MYVSKLHVFVGFIFFKNSFQMIADAKKYGLPSPTLFDTFLKAFSTTALHGHAAIYIGCISSASGFSYFYCFIFYFVIVLPGKTWNVSNNNKKVVPW